MRNENRPRVSAASAGPPRLPNSSAPDPIQVLCGPMLCRLHIWSDAAWAVLPVPDRPNRSVHVPGLGWVGAVPVQCLN